MTGRRVIPFPRPFGATPAAPAPPSDANPAVVDTLRQVLPIAQELLRDDATYDVETLKARIRNHEQLARTMPEPLRTLYVNKVKVLKAKLRAARVAQGREAEDRASKWEWAALGKTAVGASILVGASLVALLLASTHRIARSGAMSTASRRVARKRAS